MPPKPPQYLTYGIDETQLSSLNYSHPPPLAPAQPTRPSSGLRKLSVKEIQNEILKSPIFQKVRQLYQGDTSSSQQRSSPARVGYPGTRCDLYRTPSAPYLGRSWKYDRFQDYGTNGQHYGTSERKLSGTPYSATIPGQGYYGESQYPLGLSRDPVLHEEYLPTGSVTGFQHHSHSNGTSKTESNFQNEQTFNNTTTVQSDNREHNHTHLPATASASIRNETQQPAAAPKPRPSVNPPYGAPAPPDELLVNSSISPKRDLLQPDQDESITVNGVIYRSQPSLRRNELIGNRSHSQVFSRSDEERRSGHHSDTPRRTMEGYNWQIVSKGETNQSLDLKPSPINRFNSERYMDKAEERNTPKIADHSDSHIDSLSLPKERLVPMVVECSNGGLGSSPGKASGYDWHSLQRPDSKFPPSTMFGTGETLRRYNGQPHYQRQRYQTMNPKLTGRRSQIVQDGAEESNLSNIQKQNLSHSEGDLFHASGGDPDIQKIATPPPDYDRLESTSSSDDEASYNQGSRNGDAYVMYNRKFVDVQPKRAGFNLGGPLSSLSFISQRSNPDVKRRRRARRRYTQAASYRYDLSAARKSEPPVTIHVGHPQEYPATNPVVRTYGNVIIDHLSHQRAAPRRSYSIERRTKDALRQKSPARTPSAEIAKRRIVPTHVAPPKSPVRQPQSIRRAPVGLDTSDGSGLSSTLGRHQHTGSTEPSSSILNNASTSDYTQSDRDSSFSGRKSSRKRVQFEDEIRKDTASTKPRNNSRANEYSD